MQKLLEQLVICINYSGLLESDVEEIVRDTRGYFLEHGFTIKEGVHKNINVQLNDPEQIKNPIVSNTEVLRKYVYNRGSIDITVTKSAIDIHVAAGREYEGFDIYKEYLTSIVAVLESKFDGIVHISRIGIRKFNSLFIKNIEKIEEYFNKKVFNCVAANGALGQESGEILFSRSNLTVVNKKNKVNLATEIQAGEAQEINDGAEEKFNVYRIILDIDGYWDEEIEQYSSIDQKLTELNEAVTNIYHQCLNENFKNKLLQDPPIEDENIFGGVK